MSKKYCLIEVYKTFSDDYNYLEKKANKHYYLNLVRFGNRYLAEEYIRDFDNGITDQLFLINDDDLEE